MIYFRFSFTFIVILFVMGLCSCSKKVQTMADFEPLFEVEQTAEQIALDKAFLANISNKTAKGSMGPFSINYAWSEDGRVWAMMMGKSSVFIKAVSEIRAIYQLDDYLVGVDLREGMAAGATGFIYSNMNDKPKVEEDVFVGGPGLSFTF